MADRVVRLFEPVLVADDGTESSVSTEFWSSLFSELKKNSDGTFSEFDIRKGRNDIKGKVKGLTSPSVEYLYVGRDRRPEDFPDHRDPVTSEEGDLEVAGELVEPSYLLPINGTSYISLCRTTAGPRSEAVSSWLSGALSRLGKKELLDLRPVMRGDALARLRNSEGVQRVYVKVRPGSVIPEPAGSLSEAVNSVKDDYGSDTYVAIEMSYGNATADQSGSSEAKRDLEHMLMSDVEFASAEATLRVVDDNGAERREHVKFSRDAFAENVRVPSDLSEHGRATEVISAMLEANDRFARGLRSVDKL